MSLRSYQIAILCNNTESLSLFQLVQSFHESKSEPYIFTWHTTVDTLRPQADLVLVDHLPRDSVVPRQLIPLFSHTRILLFTYRGQRDIQGRRICGLQVNTFWTALAYLVIPFDVEEVYERMRHMLQKPRRWYVGIMRSAYANEAAAQNVEDSR